MEARIPKCSNNTPVTWIVRRVNFIKCFTLNIASRRVQWETLILSFTRSTILSRLCWARLRTIGFHLTCNSKCSHRAPKKKANILQRRTLCRSLVRCSRDSWWVQLKPLHWWPQKKLRLREAFNWPSKPLLWQDTMAVQAPPRLSEKILLQGP